MTGYILQESDLESIKKEVAGDPKIHCLVGHGVGNQFYSVGDLKYMGLWTQDKYEVPGGFKDTEGTLKPFTDAKYAQRQTDYIWTVTYPQDAEHKLLLRAGDFVTLKPLHENSEYLSCQNIETSADGRVTLELGAKRPTFLDSKEVIQNSPHGFIDRYMMSNHETITQNDDFYPSDPLHAALPATMTFVVPAKVKEVADRPRITLSISMSPKTDIDPIYGRVALIVSIDGVKPNFGEMVATTVGKSFNDSIPEVDITTEVTAGATVMVYLGVHMAEEYTSAHTAYTEHPVISASATMNFYKRGALTT